ncbi:DUF5819 family protein [Streptomyces sp. NPDC092296]|uniref:DUF5819 family protein n=1 Tax=Streptomyces sp. NPDC092296 TaxID=3366012 RepID=UPI00382C3FF2
MEQPSGEVPERSAPPDEPTAGQAGPSEPEQPSTPEQPSDPAASSDPAEPDGPKEPEQPATAPGRAWSTSALALLSMSAVLLAGATAWHLGAVFLDIAPSNTVSQQYRQQVDEWVYPEFEQNWKLFAPNPLQQNIAVEARVQTLGQDGSHHTGQWIGLTAQDVARIRHNPIPGHVDQNLLRRAWDLYSGSHNSNGDATDGQRSELHQQYLKRIVLQRLGREQQGERVVEVQLRAGTTSVSPPPWSSESWATGTSYQETPWWPVSDQDYAGL